MALPARGAKAGIKADVQAAKDGGAGYTVSTATSGWSHDFLNKKPWHPSSFRNQLKKFEAEQALISKTKREEVAKAEFDAEQRYLDTLSHLPSKDADKYRQRQSVSWMYLKPPGMDAWEEKNKHEEKERAAAQAETQAAAPAPAGVPSRAAAPTFAAAADGRKASVTRSGHARGQGTAGEWDLNVKKRERSPPRGGFSWQDDNQQFLEVPDKPLPDAPAPVKRHKSGRKEKKKSRTRERSPDDPDLAQALQTLAAAGVDLDNLLHAQPGPARGGSKSAREKSSRKEKGRRRPSERSERSPDMPS